jgi:hypothetical protein
MHDVDELTEALDLEFPLSAERVGDWEDVLARSDVRPARRRRRRSPLVALAAAVTAVAVGILLWPGGDDSTGILERARAVATDGPIVHLILGPEDSHLTEVDLDTGEVRRLPSRREQWFDPERGIHDLHTVDGRVLDDVLYPTGSSPEAERTLSGLASAYRDALESGRASVVGASEIGGRGVHWIRFHVRYPSFGLASYEATHEVAVDAETFEPRLWRRTEGSPDLGIPERTTEVAIERWETLPAGSGDFTAAVNMAEFREDAWGVARLGPRSPGQARELLSPSPLWLGGEFDGLPRTGLFELSAERGRPGKALEKEPALELCYGTRLNETSCEPPHSAAGERYIQLTETERPQSWPGWDLTIEPREGTMILNRGERLHAQGFLRKAGIYVVVNASDEALLLAAARALEPMR